MPTVQDLEPRAYRVFTSGTFDQIPQVERLDPAERMALKAVASVLPFRVNNYVLEELIDWSNVPDDPIYQLCFPQRGMLDPKDLKRMTALLRKEAPAETVRAEADRIRLRMNPHPSGQREYNIPVLDGEKLHGMQHKYRETVLFFPSQGQTCHAYCTYCFRWAQFVGIEALKFASREVDTLHEYLRRHREVSDILFTGGDPMIMKTSHLETYIGPMLEDDLDNVRDIRIGTKAVAWWPYRFVTDPDADDLLRLFERVVRSGRNLALMAHYSHPRELSTPVAQEAIRRINRTGAVVRCQAPLIRHVNDHPDVWAELWREEVRLGCVPYYMFVERDTGPKDYFQVPLARAYSIFRDAYSRVSGLARTVRGPSMSATPGKVQVQGISEVNGEKVFVLAFLQARDPDWVRKPFFAQYDPKANWLDDLKPAFGEEKFFFTDALEAMKRGERPAWMRDLDGAETLVTADASTEGSPDGDA